MQRLFLLPYVLACGSVLMLGAVATAVEGASDIQGEAIQLAAAFADDPKDDSSKDEPAAVDKAKETDAKASEAKDADSKESDPKDTAKAERAKAEAAAKSAAEEYELQKLFADTIDQVERNYVKNISRRELMEAAIRGVLTKLDPYSNYISPDDLGQFKTNVENQFGGIGIQVEIPREGQLVVISPIVGSPAYRAGMQAGDRIIEIEGESTSEIRSIDDAIKRLKGEPGSKVTITTFRPSNGKRRTFGIEREIVHVDTVMGDQRKEDDSWDFLIDHDKKIGYIRLTAFGRDTERDLTRALEDLKRQEVRGLILDLRFNPGGLLTAAIGVSDLFVAEGKIVSTEGRNTTPRSWDARKEGVFEDLPMVVLVNRYSASASEIVSACLQDHKRAVVIGERTWGKGSVQNVIEMEGGRSALKLTTAAYMRPSGKNIHKLPNAPESEDWGVRPDEGYDMKLPDDEFYRLMEYRRNRDILLVNHSGGDKEADVPAKDGADDKPKPAEEKPADVKPALDEPEKGDDKPKVEEPAKDKPDAGDDKPAKKFDDRQLKKALDYLNVEIAKAN